MKYCVSVDGDGHFMLAKLDNRPEVIKLLKEIHYGDYWTNEYESHLNELEIIDEDELLRISAQKWELFVHNFIQRGTMEIKEI